MSMTADEARGFAGRDVRHDDNPAGATGRIIEVRDASDNALVQWHGEPATVAPLSKLSLAL